MIQCNKGNWCLSSFLLFFFSLILLQICLFLCVFINFLRTHWRLLGYRAKNAEYGWFSDLFMPTKPRSLSLSHNWNYRTLIAFFFPSSSLFPWKILSSHLNYWVESVSCLIVNKRLWNIWHWSLHCKTILIWKKHHHQILRWVFFRPILNVSLLKEKPCDLARWFCVGFSN